MAAKAKAPAKAKVAPKAKVTAKTKAKPKGLVLTSAQWKAYNKAYNATARAAALNVAAQRFRKYRLQSAYSTIKQANVATSRARTSAIAAYAAKQSFRQSQLGHQNSALKSRIEQDMFNHATIAGRKQYIQGGVKGYAHAAVMRTVDTAQAKTHEQAVFAAAARAAKAGKAPKKRGRPSKGGAGAAINAQAAAAGLKAAKAIKGSAKVGRPKGSKGKAAVKKPTAKGKGAQSAKAPVTKPKARTAPYKGVHRGPVVDGNGHWVLGLNDFAGTCIMTAVANALHHQTGWWLPDEDIAYWTGRAGKRPTIGGVLFMLYALQPWPEVVVEMPIALVPGYGKDSTTPRIIGFRNRYGDHAAYAFDGQMVSYGELMEQAMDLEEVWAVQFTGEAASPTTGEAPEE